MYSNRSEVVKLFLSLSFFLPINILAATMSFACPSDAYYNPIDLLQRCAPEVTFYSAGSNALFAQLNSRFGVDDTLFDKDASFVRISNFDDLHFAWYGYGAKGTKIEGKRLVVIFNRVNSSSGGVAQLLSGLKTGSFEGGSDQQEYITLKLLSAQEERKGIPFPLSSITIQATKGSHIEATMLEGGLRDFKAAWGWDKQKKLHMAFSDLRPAEFIPGRIKKWDTVKFPSESIAMQVFDVVVNAKLYYALIARDVREGRLPSSCTPDANATSADLVYSTGDCQPNIFSSDLTSLMTSRNSSAATILRDPSDSTLITLHRLAASSTVQAAAQIAFTGMASYNKKSLSLDGSLDESILGNPQSNGFGSITPTSVEVSPMFTIKTWPRSGFMVSFGIGADVSGYSIGYISGFTAPVPYTSSSAAIVKLDGISPNFSIPGISDRTQMVGLRNGYSFSMEFQALRRADLTSPYKDIYDSIVEMLKHPANRVSFGIGPILSTTMPDDGSGTPYTRGGNNFKPLSRY
jgi:hypothetical protein